MGLGDSSSTVVSSKIDLLDCLQSEGISLVSSLRANSSVPNCVIPRIMESFNEVSKSLVMTCQAEAIKCLSSLCEGNSDLLKTHLKLI